MGEKAMMKFKNFKIAITFSCFRLSNSRRILNHTIMLLDGINSKNIITSIQIQNNSIKKRLDEWSKTSFFADELGLAKNNNGNVGTIYVFFLASNLQIV